ncbi:hypothetical protein HG531_009439 [Fusarium graminearum]|nr:hypothetical protein HG531_009439 [Fusarium graminearum]
MDEYTDDREEAATLPPALVLFVRELNHVGQRLLRSFRLVLVENQCAVLRSQVEQGGCVASVASLAVVVLVEAAGIHLEDDDVLEGCVWQSGLALYIADTLGGFGEVFVDGQVPNNGETSVLETGNVCDETDDMKSSLLELGEA